MRFFTQNKKRGFTIFFATLVASLALAIGLGIYDIVVRQLSLSTTVSQSQYAIYAADSGAECALYWDSKYGGAGSAFATSSVSTIPSSGIICGSYDMAAKGTPPVPFVVQPTGWTAWSVVSASNAATTTFTLTFPGYSYCSVVQVSKSEISPGLERVIIYSHGYNTCATGAAQLERELKVTY